MAAYPSYTIGLASSQTLEPGTAADADEAGGFHTRAFHDKQYYRWVIVHPDMSSANFESLLTTYAADPSDTHTLTWRSIAYDVQFTAPPVIVENLGNDLYVVEARLYGAKQ